MKRMKMVEISEAEVILGRALPGLYKNLLTEVGYGQIDPNKEIYCPTVVKELYEPFFENPIQLFNPYFPFGCNNETQEMWVIDAASETAASISHETVPDDWPEEELVAYERWVAVFLDPVLLPLECNS